MKLNLTVGNSGYDRNDYRNLNPYGDDTADVACLDEIADDAECEDIIALDVIDYMPASEREAIIDHWLRKLRHGGTITIGGIDMLLVAKAVASRTITIDDAKYLLYGDQQFPWQYRKSTMTLSYVSQILASRGMKVMSRRTREFFYYVTARRE